MNKTNKNKKNEQNNQSEACLAVTDEKNAVTIRITGKAYENLKKVAEVYSRWSREKATPAEVVDMYMVSTNSDFTNLETMDTAKGGDADDGVCPTLAGYIVDWAEGRTDDLRSAFRKAGITMYVD